MNSLKTDSKKIENPLENLPKKESIKKRGSPTFCSLYPLLPPFYQFSFSFIFFSFLDFSLILVFREGGQQDFGESPLVSGGNITPPSFHTELFHFRLLSRSLFIFIFCSLNSVLFLIATENLRVNYKYHMQLSP